MPRPERASALVLVCSATFAAVLGCGSTGSGASAGVDAAESSASTIANPADETAAPVDVCSLVSPQDITALLGATVAGKSGDYTCLWENPDNLESVSLELGSPGTAVNGTLPELGPDMSGLATPGPDGMRFLGPGSVQFPAGGRVNTVQVAVLGMLDDGAADDAAVDLARKIGPRVPE